MDTREPARPSFGGRVKLTLVISVFASAIALAVTFPARGQERPPEGGEGPPRSLDGVSRTAGVGDRKPLSPSPLTPPPTPTELASVPVATPLRADAGDDQIGLVGRQITLNGSR